MLGTLHTNQSRSGRNQGHRSLKIKCIHNTVIFHTTKQLLNIQISTTFHPNRVVSVFSSTIQIIADSDFRMYKIIIITTYVLLYVQFLRSKIQISNTCRNPSNPKVMSRNNNIYSLRDFDTAWGSKFRDIKFLCVTQFLIFLSNKVHRFLNFYGTPVYIFFKSFLF